MEQGICTYTNVYNCSQLSRYLREDKQPELVNIACYSRTYNRTSIVHAT